MQIEDLNDTHMKYLWAAYRKGAFDRLGEPFARDDMDPNQFSDALMDYIEPNFNGGWAVADKDGKPFGIVLAWVRGRVIEIGDMIWFPWGSKRQVFEGAVRFMETLRRDAVVLEFAQEKDRKFFERICDHGIMRKIGYSQSVYPEGRAVIFETLAPKEAI